jgi:regulator of nonsense transcripts 2
VFLDDFKWNIENIANLLETCGRFLLRYEGTAETAKSMASVQHNPIGSKLIWSRSS